MNVTPLKNDVYIIFLDIDGVLHRPWDHPPETTTEIHVKNFNQEALANLDSLINAFPGPDGSSRVRIVVSSSWRLLGDIDMLRVLFRQYHFVHYIIDKTPTLGPRAQEILQWLNNNFMKYNILNFIVIDDYPLGMEVFGPRYIQTFEKTLFDAQARDRAIAALSNLNIKMDLPFTGQGCTLL